MSVPVDQSDQREELMEALARTIRDQRVLGAIAAVPRELFVEPRDASGAYNNVALPIRAGQTISQPLVVARMCELLAPQPGEIVLDVGTGSGYHAAVLAQLCQHVFTIERHPALSHRARRSLRLAGVANVSLAIGDGCQGWPQHAPFHAINVAAAAFGEVPPALAAQLAPGGRLIAPVRLAAGLVGNPRLAERLVLVVRALNGQLRQRLLDQVRFVPLVSAESPEPPA